MPKKNTKWRAGEQKMRVFTRAPAPLDLRAAAIRRSSFWQSKSGYERRRRRQAAAARQRLCASIWTILCFAWRPFERPSRLQTTDGLWKRQRRARESHSRAPNSTLPPRLMRVARCRTAKCAAAAARANRARRRRSGRRRRLAARVPE